MGYPYGGRKSIFCLLQAPVFTPNRCFWANFLLDAFMAFISHIFLGQHLNVINSTDSCCDIGIQFAMKTLWIHACLLSILLPLLTAQLAMPKNPGKLCRAQFKWNESMNEKGVKLLDDCEILKDNLTLNGQVERITDHTKCISYVDLTIKGFRAKKWMNSAGKPLVGREITFQNELDLAHRRGKVWLTVSAKNDLRPIMEFSSQFQLDSTNCPEDEGHNLDEGSKEDQTMIPIIIGVAVTFLASIPALVIIICWVKKKCRREPKKEKENTDENDTYGTYSRGWDGEGEYGDGDNVYVTDTNYYYAS